MPFSFAYTEHADLDVGQKMANQLRDKLREHRKRIGLSLDELAIRSGTSKSYLWELENRDVTKPSAEKLIRIASELDVTVEYLLDEGAGLDDQQVKEAFFRKFSSLSQDDQERIRDMINIWGKK
jgi:transcriptional regulator with XRE-family HTH domain